MTSPILPSRRADRTRNWLASLMLHRGNEWLPRFGRFYARLARRPRGWRRQLRRRLAVTVTGAALLLALAGFNASANTDSVINVANGEVRIANNGKCSLIEAIRNANNQNTGQPHADCAPGNPLGADTIVLPKDGVFTLTTANNDGGEFGPNGLPWIGSAVTIEGNGSIIQRKDTEEYFRIMAVGPKGDVDLNNVIIQGGRSYYYNVDDPPHDGGGIFNLGRLTITGSTIAENSSYAYGDGSGGGIENRGILTITGSIIRDNFSEGYFSAAGGGIYNDFDGELTIVNSQISGNKSFTYYTYTGAFGGGVAGNGRIMIQDSIIRGNVAEGWYGASGGGVGVSFYGEAYITGTVFMYNRAIKETNYEYFDFGGGAISNLGQLTLANVTLSGNESDMYGGGLANYAYAAVINSTIVGNVGGGIFTTCEDSFTNVMINRSIISGNIGAEVTQNDYYYCSHTYGVTANSFNIFGRNGNAGVRGFRPGPTDIIPSGGLNTVVLPLADNGGPT